MISNQRKAATVQVWPELGCGPDYRECFFLGGVIVLFCFGETSTGVRNDVFLTVVLLRQDGAQSRVTSICRYQEVDVEPGESQQEGRSKASFQIVEGTLGTWSPFQS